MHMANEKVKDINNKATAPSSRLRHNHSQLAHEGNRCYSVTQLPEQCNDQLLTY